MRITSKISISTTRRGRNIKFISAITGLLDDIGIKGGVRTRGVERGGGMGVVVVSGTGTSSFHTSTTIDNKAIRTPRGIRNSIIIGSRVYSREGVSTCTSSHNRARGGGDRMNAGTGVGWGGEHNRVWTLSGEEVGLSAEESRDPGRGAVGLSGREAGVRGRGGNRVRGARGPGRF